MHARKLIRSLAGALLCCMTLFAAGCTSYYAITEPATGKTYYATEFKTSRSGATRFVDARNGVMVSIRESEIREITEQEFKAAGGKD